MGIYGVRDIGKRVRRWLRDWIDGKITWSPEMA